MKYIEELLINDTLDFDSIVGIKIDYLNIMNSEIERMDSETSLKIFKAILKNEDNIFNSISLIKKFIDESYSKSVRLIAVPQKNKKIDPNIEEIISHSLEKTIDYLFMCKREGITTNLKINEKELLDDYDKILITKYIDEIKQSRFPEAEDIILTKLGYSIEYASKYIKEPWKELEEKLDESSSKIAIHNYIKSVLIPYFKQKFPNKNLRSLIQKYYPSYENKLMTLDYTTKDIHPVTFYAQEVVSGRWIEFEKDLEERIKEGEWLSGGEISDYLDYMINMYPGRWKAIESFFINFENFISNKILITDYIDKKVISEYKENIKTFNDLVKYKDDIQMWDSLLGKAIKLIVIPLYNIIKERNLINYNDREERKKLFLEYFPQNFKSDFIFTSLLNFE